MGRSSGDVDEMATIELKGNGQLRIGRTEIDVPHKGGIITSVLPLIGPNYHKDVMGEIDSASLLRPTTAQTLSLLDLAFQNPDDQHCEEILNRFRRDYLRTSTESLSFPEGVIVYDNIDGQMPSTSSELMKLVEAGNKRTRFVKEDFKTGWMSISDFLKHPYTIAQIGEDMIPVAERVAKQLHKKEAYVSGLSRANSDTKRFTALGGYGGGGFSLSGGYDGGGGGCASGILSNCGSD